MPDFDLMVEFEYNPMARPATPILSPSSRIPDLVEGHISGKDLDMEAQERTVLRCTVCDWYYLSEEGLWNHVQLHDVSRSSF